MAQKDSFLFYRSYIEAVDKLPAERRYAYLRALAYYALDGTEPELEGAEELAFGLMKANIDSCNKRYAASVENGKRGGNPNFQKGVTNPYYASKKITKDNSEKKQKNASELSSPQTRRNTGKKITQDNQRDNPNDNVNVNDNYHCTSSGEGLRPHSPPNDGRGTKDEPEQIEQNRTGWRPVVE